jgi:hypothetical protein
MSANEVIIGIDLGTTNSLVAYADERGPRIDRHNARFVIQKAFRILCGVFAFSCLCTIGCNSVEDISSTKECSRFIGQKGRLRSDMQVYDHGQIVPYSLWFVMASNATANLIYDLPAGTGVQIRAIKQVHYHIFVSTETCALLRFSTPEHPEPMEMEFSLGNGLSGSVTLDEQARLGELGPFDIDGKFRPNERR